MPSFVASQLIARFPVGTTLSVYSAIGYRPGQGVPNGSVVTTAAVGADGLATFTGLAAEADYIAGAVVGGAWVGFSFRSGVADAVDLATQAELDAHAATEAAARIAGDAAALGGAPLPDQITDLTTVASPYGFDGVAVPTQPQGDTGTSVLTRITTRAPGSATGALECAITSPGGGSAGTSYARGQWEHATTLPNAWVQGSELWFGAAYMLEPGLFAAKASSVDLLRLDSLVDDNGNLQVSESLKQRLAIALFNDDSVHVVKQDLGGASVDLSGGLPPDILPEGQWLWVELHVVLSATDGQALTELWIDNKLIAASVKANYVATAAIPNRIRYGIVATGGSETGSFKVWVSRAYWGHKRLGPDRNNGAVTPGLAVDWRRRAGTLDEYPPLHNAIDGLTLTNQRLQLVGPFRLRQGQAIKGARFKAGSTASTSITNQWACLVRVSDLAVLAKSTDQTTTAWGANVERDFTWASPYISAPPASADYEDVMIGLVLNGTGLPNVRGKSGASSVFGGPPILGGSANTGLTNPASLGANAGAISADAVIIYGALL